MAFVNDGGEAAAGEASTFVGIDWGGSSRRVDRQRDVPEPATRHASLVTATWSLLAPGRTAPAARPRGDLDEAGPALNHTPISPPGAALPAKSAAGRTRKIPARAGTTGGRRHTVQTPVAAVKAAQACSDSHFETP